LQSHRGQAGIRNKRLVGTLVGLPAAGRCRNPEAEALAEVDAKLRQGGMLVLGLDALADDLAIHLTPELHEASDQRPDRRVSLDRVDSLEIEPDRLGPERLDVAQARVAAKLRLDTN
jgi:hypothetical protein